MKSEIQVPKFEFPPRRRSRLALLVANSLAVSTGCLPAQFAVSVWDYTPGVGAGTLTNAASSLGSPSVQTVDPNPIFGGTFPVNPFNSPYLDSQLVTIGDGGSLTVGFASPILDRPGNLFGLDFLIFGNAGFVITNGDFGGGGITDGSLYGAGTGNWRVSVSSDGLDFFPLEASLAPAFDAFYPTDGQGIFGLPANPMLQGSDFAGLGLAGIRGLYAGSGGGTGYDLAWARDPLGQPAALTSVSFVRVESLGGVAQVDAFAVAVPEPGILALVAAGAMALVLERRRRR